MKEKKQKQVPPINEANKSKDRGGEFRNATTNQGGNRETDNDSFVAGRRNATERNAGISTKKNVTGSDLDGQVSP